MQSGSTRRIAAESSERLAERSARPQVDDAFRRQPENIGEHMVGIRAQFRRGTCRAAEACAPGQSRQHTGTVPVPEVAIGQMRAFHQILVACEGGRRNAGLPERFGDLPTDQAWHVQNLINSLLIQTTTDGEEGRQAFNEKRKPSFDGKLRKRGDAWPDLSEEDAKRLDEAYRSGEF